MEKINTDYKWRIWKMEAKLFNMCKPWLSSFNHPTMEKIDTDYKRRIWKIEAKLFKMRKPWRSSFKPWLNGLASSCKLNLRRDLRWVAKRTRKFLTSTRKSHKNPITRLRVFMRRQNEWTNGSLQPWLGLGGHTTKILHRLACNFDLDQSERKSLQMSLSAGKTCSDLAKRSRKYTQVFNLPLLASPFGQGFTQLLAFTRKSEGKTANHAQCSNLVVEFVELTGII